jgi:selenocysteine-specific elongation factor
VRVIGTAGHVDHGKTTLIEALTGINPDRLPEEKARGMTIDLGFAWFEGEGGEPVGVIDVPGHERFIRNMVAGAWSLDCALLLVAADDGWMQQSQDHAVVLSALGVGVILVITKADAAAPERVESVRTDAAGRCHALFGREPPSIAVSALGGKNIAELKALILQTLAALPAPAERGFPWLFVDRVFVMKGAGLVVTGSLKGAPLAREDELLLLPQNERVRVRGLQTYSASVDRAFPTSRAALNIAKTRGEIRRGDCLTSPGAPFHCEREFLARIHPLAHDLAAPEGDPAGKAQIKNHSEVEVALGTTHRIAGIHFLEDRRFARVVMREPVPALWNSVFLVIRHGGSALLGSGRILWPGEVRREDRGRMTRVLAGMPDPLGDGDRFALELAFHGAARIEEGARPAGAAVLGRWAFHPPWLESLRARILQEAGQPAGAAARELASKLSAEEEAVTAVLSALESEGALETRGGIFFRRGEPAALSPAARRILDEMKKLGRTGFEPATAKIEGSTRELGALVRTGAVVPLEGGIFYMAETYKALAADILAGRTRGDRFSVPQAKERTGLSRKYTLPLLNRMERDGILKREGDERVVVQP